MADPESIEKGSDFECNEIQRENPREEIAHKARGLQMKVVDIWKEFKVSLCIRTKQHSTRRRVRDITGVFDFTHSISPQIMQYVLTKDCSKFKDHLQNKGFSLDENKQPIEICQNSGKSTVENLEDLGDELCDVISHFIVGYDVRTIVLLTGMDISTIDSTLSSSLVLSGWNEEKNLLYIFGENNQVENVYHEIQEKNEGLWTYPQNVSLSFINESEKNFHIVASTEVKSHIVKQSSLTIDALPYVCDRKALLRMLSTPGVQSSMKEANAKLKGGLGQPMVGELETISLAVLNSFISFTCGYICRSLQVSPEIRQDVQTKLTGFEYVSIVWDEDGNSLWVCSTTDTFQTVFEDVMKIIQGSKIRIECAQVAVKEEEETMTENLKGSLRTGRTFKKTEETPMKEIPLSEDITKRRYNTDESFKTSLTSTSTLLTPLAKVGFTTKEGLKVMIYNGSITRLDVDCIVSASNENLWHGGGVAAAISEAAGYAFDDESKDYIAKYGPIPVGKCAVTSAGRLPYKYVIHTVGPRWSDYSDKDRCLRDLCESVEVTFRKADDLGMKSIALPAISSGIFGVPGDKCVEQYYKAVMTFSRSYPFQSLREIHFVDRDPSMVNAIQAIFQQRTSSSSCYSTTQSSEAPGSGQTPDDKKMSSAHRSQFNKHASAADSIIKISDMLTIKVHLGNITDVTADIVVCPQDEYCSSNCQVAKEILNMIPSQSENPSSGKKKIGQILLQNIFGNAPWKMIIHAVTPRWNKDSAKNPGNFERTLNSMIKEIIKNADESKYFSIAVPLLGAGVGDYTTPMETCARNLYKAVKATYSSLIHLKGIYLVVKEEAAEKEYLNTFEEAGFQVIPKICPDPSQPGSKTDWGKTIKSSELPQEQENCSICMDIPTKPKRLEICHHIFCKECIEQYFKYKPACPSCGQIYGKKKGDQPPGTMSMRKVHQRLEGFTDCNSCIVVTYMFQNGSQGPDHPNPGKWYKGVSRSGYFPNNERGLLVAKLLNVAFSRRLVFTIGRSRTTGQDGVITWNEIHHKTRPDGGPQRYGYPDSTYLDRVMEELAAKGVTPESADDPEEYKEYSNFVK